jgi:dienelactone hydrolase
MTTAASYAPRSPRVETFLAVPAGGTVARNSEGSILELKDGRLLLVYQEFDYGEGDSDFFPGRLVARTSSDRGASWGDRRVIVDREPSDINVFSPSLLRLPDDRILFCFMRYHRDPSRPHSPPASGYAWVSHDDGSTFAPLATLWSHQPITLASSTLRRLASGRLIIPVCRDSAAPGERDHWQSAVCFSDDQGRSWTVGEQWVDAPKRGAMEPHVEETRPGRLLMVVRTQMGAIYSAESADQGRTWSASKSTGIDAPESCPELIRIPPTGDLLLVWNAGAYDPTWASHSGKRTPLSVAFSHDEGRTWSAPRRVESDPGGAFTNPGAAFTRDGLVILNYWTCRYQQNGYMSNYPIHLKTARFSLAWLYHDGAPDYPEHQDLTYYLDDVGVRQAIRTPDDWEHRRAHIQRHFQRAAGLLPAPERRVPLDVRVEEEVRVENLVRRKLSFRSEPGDRVSAYLFLPDTARRSRRAAVLCLHQTVAIGKGEPAGLGGSPDLHYALELARSGFVTLAPDYASLGEHSWDFARRHGYASGTMKGIWDHIRAVDLLASLPEVDPQRIGCIGHSLGGHNAIFLGLFEPRIRAFVSSCGFTRFHKDDVPSWTGPRYLPRLATVFENDADQVPFDFPELVAALAPRPFLACAATRDSDFDVSGVRDVMAEARRVYHLFGAERRLQAYYPESPHNFPGDAREKAYRFLARWLQP